MAYKAYVDSSVLVALYSEHDSQHAKARDALSEEYILHVLDIVVYEVATVLKKKSDTWAVRAFLDFISQTENLHIENTFAELPLYADFFVLQDKNSLSWVDCALLKIARTFPVITFDKELQKLITKQKRPRR